MKLEFPTLLRCLFLRSHFLKIPIFFFQTQKKLPHRPAGGSKSAIGSTPCFVFQGDHFEHLENFKLLKSILLDFFRGWIFYFVMCDSVFKRMNFFVVEVFFLFILFFLLGKENELLNLASLDHVIFVSSSPADETTAHFRHYKVHLKKSGFDFIIIVFQKNKKTS